MIVLNDIWQRWGFIWGLKIYKDPQIGKEISGHMILMINRSTGNIKANTCTNSVYEEKWVATPKKL